MPELGGFNGKTVVELDYPRLAADALNRAGGLGRLAALAGDPFVLHTRFGIRARRGRHARQRAGADRPDAGSVRRCGARVPGGLRHASCRSISRPSTGYLRQDLGAAFQDQIRVARPFKTPYNNTVHHRRRADVPAMWRVGATYVHRLIRNILGVRLTNLSPQSRIVGAAITTDGGPIQRTYGRGTTATTTR